jgi:signal transduction histidine kinase
MSSADIRTKYCALRPPMAKLEGEDLVAEVSDDGQGFGPDTVPGVGQSSMRERAKLIGGELEIESQPGQGTSVRLRVPLPQGVQQ